MIDYLYLQDHEIRTPLAGESFERQKEQPVRFCKIGTGAHKAVGPGDMTEVSEDIPSEQNLLAADFVMYVQLMYRQLQRSVLTIIQPSATTGPQLTLHLLVS